MLTTCPECRTTFRLSQAQLEARRGLVRCGFCKAVFNAYDTLLPEFDAPPVAQDSVPADAIVASTPPLEDPGGGPAARSWPEPEAETIQDAGPVPKPMELAPPSTQPEHPVAPEPEPGQADYVLHLSGQPGETAFSKVGGASAMSGAEPVPSGVDAILLSELPTRDRIEPRPELGHRLLFGLASSLLLLILAGQLVYFLRGALVAWQPDLRPALEAACAPLGCRIPLASDANAIRVESSSLETDPEQPNRATLRVSISNRSRVAQQWPYLILKLTDWQGGPLAQRAFRPADYLEAGQAGQPGMAAMSEKEFRLVLDLGGLSASGYEVTARYP